VQVSRAISMGIIGVGWIGGLRARTCASHPLVESLHLCEIDPDRLRQMAKETGARTATTDYHELLSRPDIDAIIVTTTPEPTHCPVARDCLLARKHVLLEKPMGLELKEADELMALARAANLKLTIGYTQRFNPKFAYVKQCLTDGTLGRPVTALVSRHLSRSLGNKIGGRVHLSPAVMEATHDIDFVLWCMEPRKPIRVYSQYAYGVMKAAHGLRRLASRHRAEHDGQGHGAAALHDARRAGWPRLPGPDAGGDHSLHRSGGPGPAGARHARAGAPGDGSDARRRSVRRAQ
jgi:predicted dehydrogenase